MRSLNPVKRRAYFDYSATTPIHPKVAKVIKRYLTKRYANPSSAHESGLIAKSSIELARESIANDLACRSEQLIFTGSGSESNNTALQGFLGRELSGQHIITSMIEHGSITNTVEALREKGLNVSFVKVDRYGRYDLEHLKGLVQPSTRGIFLSYVNSEIGTIQDTNALVEFARTHQLHLHLDAVQALSYSVINLEQLGADSVSFSGHKIGAPKGIGLLYVREPKAIKPLLYGGSQENAMRAGTENVPYIMGLAKAVALNAREKHQHANKVYKKQEYIIQRILQEIPDVQLTGHPTLRSPHHASFCFKGVDGKQLVERLSQSGYDVSSGTACSSKRRGPSKVIESCGIDEAYQLGSLRISLSPKNTKKQLSNFVKALKTHVEKLRTGKMLLVPDVTLISQEALHALIATQEPMQILNVSPFLTHHEALPKMIHAPIWTLKKQLKQLNPNTATVLICQHGDILAPKSAKLLVNHGFTDVRVLQGGFFALRSA